MGDRPDEDVLAERRKRQAVGETRDRINVADRAYETAILEVNEIGKILAGAVQSVTNIVASTKLAMDEEQRKKAIEEAPTLKRGNSLMHLAIEAVIEAADECFAAREALREL
jgi:hypothetical protein